MNEFLIKNKIFIVTLVVKNPILGKFTERAVAVESSIEAHSNISEVIFLIFCCFESLILMLLENL